MLCLVDQKGASLMAAQDKSQESSFVPNDEKEAQKKLARLRKKLRKNVTHKTTRTWTGLKDKTLWDWLQLLLIPLVLTVGGFMFSTYQHNTDQQQVLDQQRQATFVQYQNDMKDLLFNRGLLTSKPSDEIRVIVRTETLSAIRQLDGIRISSLVQFLKDARLTGNGRYIVSFIGVDLSDAVLSGANLSNIDFSDANLNDANLSNTELNGANLFNANLSNANLTIANLSNADLSGAQNLTQKQLDQVSLCDDAMLPTGLICHHNL